MATQTKQSTASNLEGATKRVRKLNDHIVLADLVRVAQRPAEELGDEPKARANGHWRWSLPLDRPDVLVPTARVRRIGRERRDLLPRAIDLDLSQDVDGTALASLLRPRPVAGRPARSRPDSTTRKGHSEAVDPTRQTEPYAQRTTIVASVPKTRTGVAGRRPCRKPRPPSRRRSRGG